MRYANHYLTNKKRFAMHHSNITGVSLTLFLASESDGRYMSCACPAVLIFGRLLMGMYQTFFGLMTSIFCLYFAFGDVSKRNALA